MVHTTATQTRHRGAVAVSPHAVDWVKEIPMSSLKHAPPLNDLLAALPRSDRQHLLARSTQVELTYADVLYESGERIRHVHFPNRGLISLLTPMHRRPSVEVCMVGREGMAGIPLFLGVDVSPMR